MKKHKKRKQAKQETNRKQTGNHKGGFMKNKRVPKEVAKYMVMVKTKDLKKQTDVFHYFRTQKEAKTWAKGVEGKKSLFKIIFDFHGDL